MTVYVSGIGWVTPSGYGCALTGREYRFQEGEGVAGLARKGLFSHPFRNFGRLDNASRLTCCAVALAFRDAGIDYSPGVKTGTGILGADGEGSLASDLAYFADYVTNGRTLGRGNLFIYTLPSSPMGEAAIHFGLTGPLLYAAGGASPLVDAMEMAYEMLKGGEAQRMLAGWLGRDEALYLVIGREKSGDSSRTFDEIRDIVVPADGISGLVPEFSILRETKGGA